jgi:hypothetical protein
MINSARQGRRIQMSDDKDDLIKEMMGKIFEKKKRCGNRKPQRVAGLLGLRERLSAV